MIILQIQTQRNTLSHLSCPVEVSVLCPSMNCFSENCFLKLTFVPARFGLIYPRTSRNFTSRLSRGCHYQKFIYMKEISSMEWNTIKGSLTNKGFAIIQQVLSPAECRHLSGLYGDHYLYRNVINMQRYRFGCGEYKYFNYPLPPAIQALRELLYTPLAGLANEWMRKLRTGIEFPSNHQDLLDLCKEKAQDRPTPLILRYESGGYNTLHQDLYGEIYFPFQTVLVLSQAGRDHEGGEFVLTEQVPRAQSKVQVLQPNQGDAVIFTTNFRPVQGANGYYKAKMKHGVSEIKNGIRYSLGIIFHDAA